MQIPVLSGAFTDTGPDVRTSYPVNLIPVPKQSGVSNGYLRPSDGIISIGTGPGTDRGGINWNGTCYRVMGTKLVTVASNGTVTTLGDVGAGGAVSMDYSFDRLAITSGGRLYYWNGALTQVTDPDLGSALDVTWIDGYFATTDGSNIVVTELADPTQVNPLKYGSSEVDPDPIKALEELRNELIAINRYSCEFFDNIGGSLFPFQRIDGAHIPKGAIGTHTCCIFNDTLAFLGSGRNEPPAVYLGANSQVAKISTQEIDRILQQYTEAQLSQCVVEPRIDKSHKLLYIHLPDRTVVYDAAASEAMQEQVWFTLVTTLTGFAEYRAKHFVWAYDKWIVGDPQSSAVGYFTVSISSHWGTDVRWEFGTQIVYAEGRGAIFHSLELVALPGRALIGEDPYITTSYSTDGLSWSQDKAISAGKNGNTNKRLVWWQQGHMRHMRMQRFRGDSQAHISFMRLEAQLEPLAF